MLNVSIPALFNEYVPVSLLKKASLEVVLDKVANAQTRALDRLTSAISLQELSYYEAKLLQDFLTFFNVCCSQCPFLSLQEDCHDNVSSPSSPNATVR